MASTKIVAEYAKSNRSSCKKCTNSISANTLRLGLVSRDRRGFDMTKWHHLNCFPTDSQPIVSVDEINGFASLKSSDQEELKTLRAGCDQLPKENSDGEKEGDEGNDEKNSKEIEDRKSDEAEPNQLEESDLKKVKASPKIVAEYAKSNRSSCKKCTKAISTNTLRLGFVSRGFRGFDTTKWHHLNCFPIESHPIISVDEINGFLSLKTSDQEAVKNLMTGCDVLPKEDCDGEKEGVEVSDEKSLKELNVHKSKAGLDEPEERDSKKLKASPKIVADYAKSNRSSCKTCTKAISTNTLRFGFVSRGFRGFDTTKWHHLNCFPIKSHPIISVDEINGFSSLKTSDQEAVKILMTGCDGLPKEGCDGVKEGVVVSDEKSLKELKGCDGEMEGVEVSDEKSLKELKVRKSKAGVDEPEERDSKKLKASPKIVAEYAKSNRSSCKKCTKAISTNTLRLGLVSKGFRGFDTTKWHHLNCFPIESHPIISVDEINGFSSLKTSDQEAVKNLMTGCDGLPKELLKDCGGEKERVEVSDEKSLKELKIRKSKAGLVEPEESDSKMLKSSDQEAVKKLTAGCDGLPKEILLCW